MKEEQIIKKVKCKRCGYEWFPKKPGRPLTCAKCRSPYWDRDIIRPKAKKKKRRQ